LISQIHSMISNIVFQTYNEPLISYYICNQILKSFKNTYN